MAIRINNSKAILEVKFVREDTLIYLFIYFYFYFSEKSLDISSAFTHEMSRLVFSEK